MYTYATYCSYRYIIYVDLRWAVGISLLIYMNLYIHMYVCKFCLINKLGEIYFINAVNSYAASLMNHPYEAPLQTVFCKLETL